MQSCKESPSTVFKKDGVVFTCPSGWSITDEDSLEGLGNYLSIEKDGFNSSGIMTVTWLYNEISPEDVIAEYQVEMANNIIYKNSSLSFSNPFKNKFKNYDVISVRFTMKLVGMKHQGIISAFNYGGRSYCIFKQEANEDGIKNEDGFNVIENSFKIKAVQD